MCTSNDSSDEEFIRIWYEIMGDQWDEMLEHLLEYFRSDHFQSILARSN